jgi:hypothetical protein
LNFPKQRIGLDITRGQLEVEYFIENMHQCGFRGYLSNCLQNRSATPFNLNPFPSYKYESYFTTPLNGYYDDKKYSLEGYHNYMKMSSIKIEDFDPKKDFYIDFEYEIGNGKEFSISWGSNDKSAKDIKSKLAVSLEFSKTQFKVVENLDGKYKILKEKTDFPSDVPLPKKDCFGIVKHREVYVLFYKGKYFYDFKFNPFKYLFIGVSVGSYSRIKVVDLEVAYF